MQLKINLEILSQVRALLGINYMKGVDNYEDKTYIFHEISLGLLFFSVVFTVYNEGI